MMEIGGGDQGGSWWLSFLLPIIGSVAAIGYHMLKPSEYEDIIHYAKKVECEGKTHEKEAKMA